MFTVFTILGLTFFALRVIFWMLRLKGRVLHFLLGGLVGAAKNRRQLPLPTAVDPRDLIDPHKFRI
jgi:hypothetical protein